MVRVNGVNINLAVNITSGAQRLGFYFYSQQGAAAFKM